MKHIHNYYSPNDLYNKIIEGISTLGIELPNLTLDDLKPVDEFHIRSVTATKELIKLAGFTRDMHILDVGCGLGGAARRLAAETGCRVTAIDLSDEYIDAAARLTKLFNLQDRIAFRAASALALPYKDNSFDGAFTIQMNMNVEDKHGLLSELYRVTKPGGRVGLYELCSNINAPLYFPVPWAQDGSMSFLISPDAFRKTMTDVGFKIEAWIDLTDIAREVFSDMNEPPANPVLPALGTHLLVGDDILSKAYNLRRNLDEERVSLIETVGIKPML